MIARIKRSTIYFMVMLMLTILFTLAHYATSFQNGMFGFNGLHFWWLVDITRFTPPMIAVLGGIAIWVLLRGPIHLPERVKEIIESVKEKVEHLNPSRYPKIIIPKLIAIFVLLGLRSLVRHVSRLKIRFIGIHGFHVWWLSVILVMVSILVVAWITILLWELVPTAQQEAISRWSQQKSQGLWQHILDSNGAHRLKAFIARYSH